tara:strand:+ start:840 stop:1079 length:240 start_codon:yes stop_codon:yes gene_type:complete
MGKPIYRVIIDFGFKKKGSVRPYVSKKIDTFVLNNVEEELKKDQRLLERMALSIKRKLKDIDIKFNKIHIEGQYGETTN